MEEIARVYASALFGAAKDRGSSTRSAISSGSSPMRSAENRDLQLFLFSPYFSSAEKSRA